MLRSVEIRVELYMTKIKCTGVADKWCAGVVSSSFSGPWSKVYDWSVSANGSRAFLTTGPEFMTVQAEPKLSQQLVCSSKSSWAFKDIIWARRQGPKYMTVQVLVEAKLSQQLVC